MSKSEQQAIAKYFPRNGILYLPGLGIVLGSVNAGIMLSQLLFWHGKGRKKPWTYKTTEDMYKETGLTRTQQETAIRILKTHNILEVERKGIPATRHFKINLFVLHELLPSLKKTYKLHYPNPPTYYAENGDTITKTTRKNTSEISQKILNKNNYRLEIYKLSKSKSIELH